MSSPHRSNIPGGSSKAARFPTGPTITWQVGQNGAMVATAGARGRVELRRTAPGTGEIVNLKVDASARRNGIGSSLMRAVIQRAQATGIHSLELVARPSDWSIDTGQLLQFYSKHGFRPAGYASGRGPILVRGTAFRSTPIQPMIARPSHAIQRMEEDKYTRQNRMAASAAMSVEEPKRTKEGNVRVTLANLNSETFKKKLAGFSSKQADELAGGVADVVRKVNAANGAVRAWAISQRLNKTALMALSFEQKQGIALGAYGELVYLLNDNRGETMLREPHVHRNVLERHGDIFSPEYIRDAGDVTQQVLASYDFVKWAWWYYSYVTRSKGWEKLTGHDRPHVPHFAELQLGGFVPRVIYDWWHNKFYATPHYNVVEEKGLVNPYIKLSKAHTWTA